MPQALTLQPIGIIHSPYKEKFAVPRQPNLVPDGTGILELLAPYNCVESVRGLEQFSHLWLIFHFNQIATGKWQATVRPPRLGGNRRIGVFATRSTHRPNPLGLSKVALRHIECKNGKVLLYLGSMDLIDGTPIFDIKPYIAYADNEPKAQSGFAQDQPQPSLQVEFSENSQQSLKKLSSLAPHFQRFIGDVIAQDPRPAYQRGQKSLRIYGMQLDNYNIRWQVQNNIALVLEINEVND